MIAYLDSSILLRLLLNQPGPLKEFPQITRPIASRLLKAECLRALDRARLQQFLEETEYLKAVEELYDAMDSIEFVEISLRVIDRVGESFPLPLGTLDAIHLASALVWRETSRQTPTFLTHDEILAHAAKAYGFPVLGT